MHLIAPTSQVPLTVKAEILMRMDSYANQSINPILKNGTTIVADGGHHQWFLGMLKLFYELRNDTVGAEAIGKKDSGQLGPGSTGVFN